MDWLLSAGSVGVLVPTMAAIDETFRRYLVEVLRGERVPGMEMLADLRVQHFGRMVTDSIGFPSTILFPFALFVAVGGVLFLFMFKI
jgi:hypothetical protein